MAVHAKTLEKPVYFVGDISTDGAAGESAVELAFPQETWVAAMDAKGGETVFKACQACHTAEKGGVNNIGPNLWNIVGKSAASNSGFNYSGAMKSAGLTWDYETLDAFLTKPSRYVKGTAMVYNGIKQPSRRAAVIEYLRVNADNPLDRPEVAVMEDTAEEVADGEIQSAEDFVEKSAETIKEGVKDVEDKASDLIDAVKETVGDEN